MYNLMIWAQLFLSIFLTLLPEFVRAQNCSDIFASKFVQDNPITSTELLSHVAQQISKTDELTFIRTEAEKMGVRAWIFGGTAASFLHYAKWELAQARGLLNLQTGRLDYHFTSIFRSTQDLDVVIDGTVEQVKKLQEIIIKKYPYLQGSKKAWEVRSLRMPLGSPGGFYKEALLDDPNFSNQNTDSNSIAMVEITQSQEPIVRDLRSWNSPHGLFMEDALKNKISYLRNPKHYDTARARLGQNPEILSALRLLVKAFQYDLSVDSKTYLDLKKVIDEFDLHDISNSAALKRLNDTAAKLILHSNNIEYAINMLDRLGLRQKLISMNLKGDGTNDASYWLNKEPLRSYGPDELPRYTSGKLKNYDFTPTGKTAKDLKISIVAHETRNILAFESIIRSHSGEPNVLISREGFQGESAIYFDGFYTKIGRYGATSSGITIRFQVDPMAREGVDFIKQDDYVIFLNKRSLTVIPELFNFNVSQLADLIATDSLKLDYSNGGQIEFFKRRLNPIKIIDELEALANTTDKEGQEKLAKIISVFLTNKNLHSFIDPNNPKIITRLVRSYLALIQKGYNLPAVNSFLMANYSECLPEIKSIISNYDPKYLTGVGVDTSLAVHEYILWKNQTDIIEYALKNSYISIAKLLIAKAPIFKKIITEKHSKFLSEAILQKNLDAFTFILDNIEIDLNSLVRDLTLNYGHYETPPLPDRRASVVTLAIRENAFEIAKYLLEKVDLNTFSITDAFYFSCEQGSLEIIKILEKKGVNTRKIYAFLEKIRMQGDAVYKYEPVKLAIRKGAFELTKYLVENGATLRKSDSFEGTALGNLVLFYSKSENQFDQRGSDFIKYLVKNGADINERHYDNGPTPLMFAITSEKKELIKALLENGADINAQSSDPESALILAIKNNSFEMVKFLIEQGANVDALTHRDHNKKRHPNWQWALGYLVNKEITVLVLKKSKSLKAKYHLARIFLKKKD